MIQPRNSTSNSSSLIQSALLHVCKGAGRAETFPKGRWAKANAGATKTAASLARAHPTECKRCSRTNPETKNLDLKATPWWWVYSSVLRSGPAITRQVHSNKASPRSSQEVSLQVEIQIKRLHSMTTTHHLSNKAQWETNGPGLSLNRAPEPMSVGGGLRWGWAGPLRLISALSELTFPFVN